MMTNNEWKVLPASLEGTTCLERWGMINGQSMSTECSEKSYQGTNRSFRYSYVARSNITHGCRKVAMLVQK